MYPGRLYKPVPYLNEETRLMLDIVYQLRKQQSSKIISVSVKKRKGKAKRRHTFYT